MTPVEMMLLVGLGLAISLGLVNAFMQGWPQDLVLWLMGRTVPFFVFCVMMVAAIVFGLALFVQEKIALRTRAVELTNSVHLKP